MWKYDSDYKKWVSTDDKLTKDNYDFLKQELSDVRLYSKCLSGASYIPVNDLNNVYDILGEYEPRNWYISIDGSPYTNTLIPPAHAEPINIDTSYDYYNKYLSEYGLTLKSLFTPNRLISDSIKNYIYVDIATTDQLFDLNQTIENRVIDGIRLKDGMRILIKDQKNREVLPNTTDPNDYFQGPFIEIQNLGATIEYEYYNSQNGIYKYNGGLLSKESDLNEYVDCVRFSVLVKLGDINREKQYHLARLNNGYYPTSSLNQPMEFIEKKNWMIRNRVDYNNLFEINYYDVLKHGTQSYSIGGVTYSIPERIVSIGEFGVINVYQESFSNIIRNKYKVNLRSISQTSTHYWICGDGGIFLKVRKHDFDIQKIELPVEVLTPLRSVSFYSDLKGVVVGDLNMIFVTSDGGNKWEKITISGFSSYYYNKVIYYSPSSFFIGGNAGIFIEFKNDINGWTAYKRRISRFIDDDDEYLLVDNINDIYYTTINTWGLSFSYSTQSTATEKELLFIVTDDSKVIAHDINGSIPGFDFVYLDFGTTGVNLNEYGDVRNITRRQGTNTFYFTGMDQATGDSGLFSFDIDNFDYIGVGNQYSNTITSTYSAVYESPYYPNEIFDYNGDELLICGNESLLYSSTYSTSFNFDVFDSTFEDRLKSKMLFLDYDIGAKLNFFRDNGEYRLPESVTFSSVISTLDFSPIVYGATSPSFMTQSEVNWFNYWQDRSMTFEYYSLSPMTDSSKVLISSLFRNSLTQSEVSISTISTSASNILELAPTILDNGHSRFNGFGLTAISTPTSLYDLYLYDYLMVAKVSSTYPVLVGDVMRLESSIVEDNFIVNKVIDLSGDRYVYMYSEFNQNIINELSTTTYSVTLTNLNLFSSDIELIERFNLHPISNGYSLEYDSYYQIDAKFNNLTSYYNLATDVIVDSSTYSMIYMDGFLKFGYTPTYNLLDYLESINDIGDPNPVFYADKEYYAMPDYRAIPMPGVNSLGTDEVYIDYNFEGNKIIFGSNLEFEWNSIFINTFVDINLYDNATYSTPSSSTERLLVMKKYINSSGNFVIEFNKKINYTPTVPLYFIDIISRRKLSQISSDLQYINNIHRSKKTKEYLGGDTSVSWTVLYETYERDINFKINTDSYTKILLSDSETIESLSAIIYTDYKNELSMNITRLEKENSIPILNTLAYTPPSYTYPVLFISCSEKHDLKTGDGAVLEFNGATGSSQELNQQYFGYHVVNVINDYNFYVDVPYGTVPLIGNDTGFVKYIKKDSFLNYQPVDLIDIGVDKRGKISIELLPENTILNGEIYKLINVDFNNYRFRLVDGLNIESLAKNFGWIYEADVRRAVIGSKEQLIWYKGIWECGRWFGGRWISGTWISGDWYGGTWESKLVKDNHINVEINEKSSNLNSSVWYGGRWYDGEWQNGTWVNGRWYSGTWQTGLWLRGIWNDGTWNSGLFSGGIWVFGTWNNGNFNTDSEPAYWIDGEWNGGDFENGIWYNGTFDEKVAESRFGVRSYNSRTSTWHGGKWINGSFHSRLNINDDGDYDVADTHKYSIWNTGQWFKGDFYGGVAYNMDYKSGTWYGGILEDIQVIGVYSTDDIIVLNGIFKFNIGDKITIIDNQINGPYSSTFGSNSNPKIYTVLYTVEDTINKWTNVYVDSDITIDVIPPVDMGLRLVSRFKSCNWKSGIWTNGIYESGQWEGGLWYNGIFNGTWM